MLELIVVIPLFLMILGGMFWLSGLLETRQGALMADRYLSWNSGLRYVNRGPVDAGTVSRLFFSDRNGVPDAQRVVAVPAASVTTAYDWSQRADGRTSVTVNMLAWIDGMLRSVDAFSGQNGTLSVGPLTVAGRYVRQAQEWVPGVHAVLQRTREKWKWLRTEPNNRNRYGIVECGNIADTWQRIAEERWPHD